MNNASKLIQVLGRHFKYKTGIQYANSLTYEVGFEMYNSFLFKGQLNEEKNIFSCVYVLNNQVFLDELLGRKLLVNSDEESIIEILDLIDHYCSLRLPDKFLEEYYKTYVLSDYENSD